MGANETRLRTLARSLTWRLSGVLIAVLLTWYITGDARMGTIGYGPSAYGELGLALDDFDLVYAYPWGGEEPMMLDLSRSLLEKLGYRVFAAATPAEALTIAERHAPEIQLLLTDVVMPGMSGTDLAALLVRRFPHFKCLYASGHFTDGLTPGGVLGDGVEFLQKPFSLSDLAAKVRKALETP